MRISGPGEQRARVRAERTEAIVTRARELAEGEGWDAVTIRRLAAEIGHSQPVIYAHFPGGKAELMTAIAERGFSELAEQLEAVPAAAPSAPEASPSRARLLTDTAEIYLAFARASPATYEVMFTLPIQLAFAAESTPEPLRRAFAAITRSAGDELAAELFWSALHGLATLGKAQRLRPAAQAARLNLLVCRFC